MKRLVAVLLAGVFVLLTVLPVLAQATQPQPDSMAVVSAHGFKDLAETGDVSVIVHWNFKYPDDYTSDNYSDLAPASLAFQLDLYDTDGTTLLGTASPYVYAPFLTNGYQTGVSAFYFSAADNVSADEPYVVRLQESALYFASPATANYTMTVATDWANSDADGMYSHVIQLCDLMVAEFPLISLKTATDVGVVFSSYGEAYFRAAIPGIQTLCPQLFYIQDYWPEEMTVTPYDQTLQDQYSIRMQGSELMRGSTRLGAHFGVTGNFVLGFFILGACIGCGVVTMKKGWGLEPGLVGAGIISLAGAVLIGANVFTIVMVATLIAVIALMFSFFGRRA